jgi:hypothetical protein
VPATICIVNANFADLIELGGYSLDLTRVAPIDVQLGLYWPQTAQFAKVYKVFVQLRNERSRHRSSRSLDL